MSGSADDLRRRILELFAGKVEDSREIEKLLGKIQSGGNYKDAEAFAWLVGNALASAYSEIKTEIPETVDEAFSRLILEDPLKRDYDVVSDAAVTVQQSLNDEAGLGLKAQPPRLNRSRVEGLIKKFAGYEKSKDGLWLLGAPIVTFSQSVADDTLKKNADFQYKAGLRPRIIRDDAYGCCEWCSRIAGTYNYPNVPKDVFKRHENCRCTVDYDPAAGKRIQDVWTKRSTIREDSGKIEKRKQVGTDSGGADFYVSPNGQAIKKELAHWIGDNMYNSYMEIAEGNEAKSFVRTAYRKNAVIGDGGTAAIRKMEKATGLNLGRNGNNHSQKVNDLIRQINNSLSKEISQNDRNFLFARLKELEEVQDR